VRNENKVDAKKPVTTKGSRIQDEGSNDEPVSTPSSFDTKDLAKNEVPIERTILLRDVAKYSAARAQLRVTELMLSKLGAVTGQGELETVRYGYILKAGEKVNVRGVGELYNGEYYVNKVTHNIERGKYTQKFELTREGTGAKKKKVHNP